MPFIGNQPTQGRFIELDSLSASATDDYTLQLNGANFSPESVNNLLVSINGVIQGSSTMSLNGAVLTVGATLSSSDTIDFVRVFGNVGTVSTPTDGSVTANKIGTGAVTSAKIADDAVTSAKLDISATNKPAFEAYMNPTVENLTDNAFVKMPANIEVFDSDNKYDNSNYRFTPAVAGKYFVYAGAIPRSESNHDILISELHIYKNGSSYRSTMMRPTNANNGHEITVFVQAIMDLDADDYVEIYATCNTTSGAQWKFQERTKSNYFGAYKIIGG